MNTRNFIDWIYGNNKKPHKLIKTWMDEWFQVDHEIVESFQIDEFFRTIHQRAIARNKGRHHKRPPQKNRGPIKRGEWN